MTPERLRNMFAGFQDLDELVIREPAAVIRDPVNALRARRLIAAAETDLAYGHWRASRDAESYAVYRACAERADAAQDELAARSRHSG